MDLKTAKDFAEYADRRKILIDEFYAREALNKYKQEQEEIFQKIMVKIRHKAVDGYHTILLTDQISDDHADKLDELGFVVEIDDNEETTFISWETK